MRHFYTVNYVYTQNPSAKCPIILVDKYIGKNAEGVVGIDGGVFARELIALKDSGRTSVEVWINSKGGNISDGFNIYGSLKNSGMHVKTVNLGVVDSTAGWIFQAGDERVWNNYALGLIHNVQGAGKHEEAVNLSIATMLSGNGKKSVDECLALMADNTVMTAKMAEDFGFSTATNSNDILSFTNSSDINEVAAAGQQQIKKLLPKKSNMPNVNEILGLSNEASEAAQLVAINKIIEARNAAETAVNTLTTELTATKTTLTDVNAKLLVAENEILTATNAAKQTAAEALIKEHTGKRLSNEPANITKWTNAAIADYDGTKALIEGMNYNATAPKPENTHDRTKSGIIVSVAEYQNAPNVRQ